MLLRNAWYIAAWVDEIGGEDDAVLGPGVLDHRAVGRPFEADGRGVDRVMADTDQPGCDAGRQSHVDQKSHRARSTVSSSASNAA